MGTKWCLVQPFGQLPAQAPFAFGRIKMIPAMECVAAERRCALACNDKHQTIPFHAAVGNKIEETHPRFLKPHAVQIKAGFNLHFSAHQFLFGAPVETGDWWRGLVERNFWHRRFLGQNLQQPASAEKLMRRSS